jgi:putative spermidine/putrescine transport system permease protein
MLHLPAGKASQVVVQPANQYTIFLRWKIAVMLLPAVLILGGLFGGGLAFALAQSLGDFSPAGEHHFTLVHYRSLLSDPELRVSIALTFLLATVATAISAAAGFAIAVALRHLDRGSRSMTALLQAPIAIPHLAFAILLADLIGQSGWVARLLHFAGWIAMPADFPALINDRYGLGIVIAYVLKETPFIALVSLTMLRRIDGDYELAAATLGASRWQRFRYVTFPLAAPSVISASLLVFAFIFGAFEVPYLLGRPYPAMLGVVAQRRFLSTDLTDRPDAIAVAVLMTVVSTLLVLAYLQLSRKLVGERPTLF